MILRKMYAVIAMTLIVSLAAGTVSEAREPQLPMQDKKPLNREKGLYFQDGKQVLYSTIPTVLERYPECRADLASAKQLQTEGMIFSGAGLLVTLAGSLIVSIVSISRDPGSTDVKGAQGMLVFAIVTGTVGITGTGIGLSIAGKSRRRMAAAAEKYNLALNAPRGCTKDAECAGDLICVEGACVEQPVAPQVQPRPVPAAAAVSGPAASPAAGCSKDVDCPGNGVCENGTCVEPQPVTAGNAPSPAAAHKQSVVKCSNGRVFTGVITSTTGNQIVIDVNGNSLKILKAIIVEVDGTSPQF